MCFCQLVRGDRYTVINLDGELLGKLCGDRRVFAVDRDVGCIHDGKLLADVIHELVEEDVALVDLIQRHEFIRLVCLVDAAWPADHGRNAGILLEQAASVPNATFA